MEFCHLWCVCVLNPFIWLSSQLTIEARICHCSCDLRKKVLWSHIRTIAATSCPHSVERNRALSWLFFYLNSIQNVCVYIGIVSGNNLPSSTQPSYTSAVVMAFKCHTGLDKYSVITPGMQLYTYHHKHGPLLSCLKNDEEPSQESWRWHCRHSWEYSSQCRAAPTSTLCSRRAP